MNRLHAAMLTSALLLLSGCQTAATAPYGRPPASAQSSSILGSWDVVSVDGMAIAPRAVTVTFDARSAFVAKIDCNRAQGTYVFTGTTLSFVGWSVTERGCDPPLRNERLIGEALRGDGYRLAFVGGSEMRLSGAHAMVLRRS